MIKPNVLLHLIISAPRLFLRRYHICKCLYRLSIFSILYFCMLVGKTHQLLFFYKYSNN
nr:MAG TPA: hypothetical protein [Caudoviricetes sp.]